MVDGKFSWTDMILIKNLMLVLEHIGLLLSKYICFFFVFLFL